MAGTSGLELSQRRCRLSDCFRGATRQRLVPVANEVRDEGVEAEWLAVAASAVSAAFPDAFDQLRQENDPFVEPNYERKAADPFVVTSCRKRPRYARICDDPCVGWPGGVIGSLAGTRPEVKGVSAASTRVDVVRHVHGSAPS